MSTSTCTDQSYQFAGIPLSPGVTATLIKTLFPGRLLKRRTIVAGVLHHHLSSGGIGPVMPIGATAKNVQRIVENGTSDAVRGLGASRNLVPCNEHITQTSWGNTSHKHPAHPPFFTLTQTWLSVPFRNKNKMPR